MIVLVLSLLNIFFIRTGCAANRDSVERAAEVQNAAQGVRADLIGLTAEELDWIEKHPVFRVGTFSLPPYIIQNHQGQNTGYMPELVRALSARVGLTPGFCLVRSAGRGAEAGGAGES